MDAGTTKTAKAQLTLGPLLYHWDAEKRRDFYSELPARIFSKHLILHTKRRSRPIIVGM